MSVSGLYNGRFVGLRCHVIYGAVSATEVKLKKQLCF